MSNGHIISRDERSRIREMLNSEFKRIGMAGAGYILKSHALAAKATSARLTMVADASLARAQVAARQFGFDQAVSSLEELASSTCDLVHILLPPAMHVPAAKMMLEAGKSVFLEKPMGLDARACEELAALAANRNLKLGVNHNFLFARGYQPIREAVHGRSLGAIDHLSLDWLFDLPLLRHGPFDAWMLDAPANLLFELAPHLLAFVLDLLGDVEIVNAHVGRPIDLPGGRRAWRHWHALGESGSASVGLNLSLSAGHADRSITLRGTAGSARYDFGRDIGWIDRSFNDNPIFDTYESTRAIGQASKGAARELTRRILLALRKRPWANPFEESVARSIWAFYAAQVVDRRHDPMLGTRVIALCQAIVEAAGAGGSGAAIEEPDTAPLLVAPNVLVVGGTGFIGRRLVQSLVARGERVRILTRARRSAQVLFAGLPVEVMEGSHGDTATAARAVEGIDCVYHLAKTEGRRWQDYVEGDVKPTRTLVAAAAAAGVRRFIYTGTIDSYASGHSRDRIDNETPLDPAIWRRNFYARSKAAAEAEVRARAEEAGLEYVILRPGIVIGAGSPPAHLGVGRFLGPGKVQYWGDGRNKLPLVLVDDVVDALVIAKDREGIAGRSLLVTGPPLLSARDYVEALKAYGNNATSGEPRSAHRYWLADMFKEIAKNIVRHPNRRWPSVHDWRCRSHAAYYDSSETQIALDWRPVADRETLIRRGIVEALDAAGA
ncbi:NAD-dependent epimerase/dehydratase family protein [Sphingomonas sp. MG17]|uniref:NAD-dependent epimerase/dehydratase family protein n=1 Tax=Sphingomonas tagetis TaxID=2949092 RepID=A0A9X2HJK5_9SPHN|nr:NAD-dependent epimerase/dehydratase family protein [Sphingomonas tagetis]